MFPKEMYLSNVQEFYFPCILKKPNMDSAFQCCLEFKKVCNGVLLYI